MNKTLISLIAAAFALSFGVANANEAAKAPAAKADAPKAEVCKDKAGKEVACPKKEEKKK